MIKNLKKLKDINDVLVSHRSITEDIQFNSEEEKSNGDSETSKEEDFQYNAWKRNYIFILITNS